MREAVSAAGRCGPIIVHCSAGVGRAGSFVVVDVQLEKYANESTIDVFHGLNFFCLNYSVMMRSGL